MSDERAAAILPTAADLVRAVADGDAALIADLLGTPALDWAALCVVLADRCSRAPAATYVQSVIEAIASGVDGDRALMNRYLLPRSTIRKLREDNQMQRRDEDSPVELTDGRWINTNGVQVWRPAREVA